MMKKTRKEEPRKDIMELMQLCEDTPEEVLEEFKRYLIAVIIDKKMPKE